MIHTAVQQSEREGERDGGGREEGGKGGGKGGGRDGGGKGWRREGRGRYVKWKNVQCVRGGDRLVVMDSVDIVCCHEDIVSSGVMVFVFPSPGGAGTAESGGCHCGLSTDLC